MLNVQVSFPELKAHAQAIRELARDPMTTLQGLAGGLRPRFEEWLNDLMKAELALHLGRDLYERKPQRNHRNGYRTRRITVKNLGTLELRIPRDRAGGFRSAVVPEPQPALYRVGPTLRAEYDQRFGVRRGEP